MIFFQYKKIVLSFLLVFILFVSYAFPQTTRAQGLLPFGGLVTGTIIPCTATGNFLLTILGPSGGTFVYDPEFYPQIYESFNLPELNVWALGLYIPNPLGCWQLGVPSDYPIPSTGIISSTVGTSLSF